MKGWLRVSCVAVAVAVLGGTGAAAPATPSAFDDAAAGTLSTGGTGPDAERPEAAGESAVEETTLARQGPIAGSVDRAVDELIRRHFSSCGPAEGRDVPCFPVSVERRWQYSVADSLEHLKFDDTPTPGRPPTLSEMSGARPGPLSASGGVSFDPVCKGRQLWKAITGGSRTYHLYRVWDRDGEHAVLRDHAMAASEWGSAPRVHYVELGSFGDECEAIAAWRAALRETRARRESGREQEAPVAVDDEAEPGGQAPEAGVSDPPP